MQVVCGAYQTLAVCLYDPKADDTEERRRGYKAKMKQWFAVPGRSSLDGTPTGKETAAAAASSPAGPTAGLKAQQRKGESGLHGMIRALTSPASVYYEHAFFGYDI